MHMHGSTENVVAERVRPGTELQDQAICIDAANGMTERELAEKHGVSKATANRAKQRQAPFLQRLRDKLQRGKVRRFMRTVNRLFDISEQQDDLRSAVNASKIIVQDLYGFGGKGGVNIHNGDVNVTNQQLNVTLDASALQHDAEREAELRKRLGLDT